MLFQRRPCHAGMVVTAAAERERRMPWPPRSCSWVCRSRERALGERDSKSVCVGVKKAKDILIHLFSLGLVEQLMTHAFVQLGGNVLVAALAEKLTQILELSLALNDRVIGPGDEKNGQVRVGDPPSIRLICAFEQLEEIQKAVVGKHIPAQRVLAVTIHGVSVAG